MRCTLCGFEYEANRAVCGEHCPFGANCHLSCCPNCGYQEVDASRSRLAAWIGRLFGRADRNQEVPLAGAVPLSRVPDAVVVEVARFTGMPDARAARLTAYGLAPGSSVRILQRRPVPVIRVGETDLGIAADVLEQIWVKVPKTNGRTLA